MSFPRFPRRVSGWRDKTDRSSGIDSGMTAASFGAVAGVGALFFLEGVPRVRRDILQRLPTLGEYWDREIPPSDNVRSLFTSAASDMLLFADLSMHSLSERPSST